VAVPLELFQKGDVYIDFPYEDLMYRYEFATRKLFCKFYGRQEAEILQDSKLFHDAISAGNVTTAEHYRLGGPVTPAAAPQSDPHA
jgi:hypothetical protein